MNIGYCKANQSLKSLRRGPGEGHAIFRKHPFSKLNVTPTFSEAVKTYKQCLRDCVANPNCWSANYGKEVLKGAFLCELLPKDRYNASSSFVSSVQDFVHYSIKTPCLDFPCQHGGTCIANYFEDTYKCKCLPGLKGKHCEEGCCNEFELITLAPHQLSATSTFSRDTGDKSIQYRHAPFNGILSNIQNRGAWCAERQFAVSKDKNQYLSIDLGTPTIIGKVATQGQEYWNNWVSTYVLKFSVDNINLQDYPRTLQGNYDRRSIKEHILNPPVLARFVRFNPTSWYTNDICMRVGIYKCRGLPQPNGRSYQNVRETVRPGSVRRAGKGGAVKGSVRGNSGFTDACKCDANE